MATKQEKKSDRDRIRKRLTYWLLDSAVIETSNQIANELFGNRKDVLAEYIRTNGSTDWVWLEENTDASLLARPDLDFGIDDSFSDDAQRFEEKRFLYEACVITTYNLIRTLHPNVMPPTWLRPTMRLLANVKNETKSDLASVIRDLFLNGRDKEAIDLLELQHGKPFIFWNEEFWRSRRDSSGVWQWHTPDIDMSKVSFVISNRFGEDEDTGDPHMAVGYAVQFYCNWHVIASVKVHTQDVSPFDDMIIFAIADTEDLLRSIVPDATARQT